MNRPSVTPHVFGIDLSLTSTGVACRHGVSTITSSGRATATLEQRHNRLVHLRDQILACIASDATLVVIEAPAYSRLVGHQHDRSGLWWLLLHSLHHRETPVAAVAPTGRCTYATGRGNASKDQVLAAVIRRYVDFDVTNNDEADALVLAAMGHDALGEPLIPVPLSHRRALDAVAWPHLTGVAA